MADRDTLVSGVPTAVVIPAYKPGPPLLAVVQALSENFHRILVVDDGSGPEYRQIFESVAQVPGVVVLRHEINRGKGGALKTAFRYALAEFPEIGGILTADADGQHRPEDILAVSERFEHNPTCLVLGSRAFDKDVPWRSSVGNSVTRWVMRILVGERLKDTQTGLRAIPRDFAAKIVDLPAMRYEFEIDMLLAAREQSVPILEERIQTVYEEGNPSSHFNPVIDSMRVYFVLLRFISVSLLTALIDNLVFFLAYRLGAGLPGAQFAGRAVAVLFNYVAVRSAVFHTRKAHAIAMPKYLSLVAASGSVAYLGIHALVISAGVPVLWAKILVESLLFFLNFTVQRGWVFGKQEQAEPWRSSRVLLWLGALSGAAMLVYGFVSTKLFQEPTWSPDGMRRFAIYTIFFWVAAVFFFVLARRYFVGVLVAAATICAVIAVGFLPVAALLLLIVSCAVLGRRLFDSDSWIVSFLAGIAVWSFAITVFAALPIHYRWVYSIGLLGTLALSRREVRLLAQAIPRSVPPFSASNYWVGALFAFVFLAHWFVVLKPEVSADGLAMHLTIAIDVATHHAYTIDFREFVWALMPMGADFCYAFAYTLGGEYAARLLNYVMLGSVACLIYRSARAWLSHAVSLLLAALFVCAPMVQLVTGSMMVENFIAAMTLGAAVAVWSFSQTPSAKGLFLCSFLLGSAVGWKIGAIAIVIVLLPIAIRATIRGWRSLGPRPGLASAAALALFLIPAIFPYGKAYVLSGNPIYPFGNSRFKSPYIQEDLQDFRFREPLTWLTPFQMTFQTNRYYEGQPGSFGFQYLLFLPICLLALPFLREPSQRAAILTGVVGAAVIAVSQPNARYLYPALSFLTIGTAAVISRVRAVDRGLYLACLGGAISVAALNVWYLPTSNWYHREFFLRPVLSERGRMEYRHFAAPVRDAVDFVNRTGDAVLFVQGSDIAGVRGPVYSNHWHNYVTRKKVEACHRPSEIYELMSDMGIERFIAPLSPDPNELILVPAMYQFLAACTTSEFKNDRYAVLHTSKDCSAKLDRAEQQRSAILPTTAAVPR